MTFNGISPMADLRTKNGDAEPFKLDYFGVGNENWGCGGNMTPQFYANEYRRYQTYVRNYDPEHPVKKICCGANVDDYYWTEKVLETTYDHSPAWLHGFMDGLSLHYYVHPGGWENKGSATEFSDEMWYQTMNKALFMDTLVTRHGTIMDKYDPDKTIGMVVDEWGGWYDCEPGTNPGFLYQQNTVRDALIAGITLNIFNKHSDRVKMAALAQMVNVLQAVLLTEGPKMIKTPTYHVMHMYRHHQGAELVRSDILDGTKVGIESNMVPKVTESVSLDKDNILTITLNNLSIEADEEIAISTDKKGYSVCEARIVTGDSCRAYNTFDNPDNVIEKDFSAYRNDGDELIVTLPKNSVVMLRLK